MGMANMSTVGLIGVAFVFFLISFLTTVLSESKNGLHSGKSLVEASNSEKQDVVLLEGFHMSWAALLCLFIAFLIGCGGCTEYEGAGVMPSMF
jgi:hypothetical protein